MITSKAFMDLMTLTAKQIFGMNAPHNILPQHLKENNE